jgi:hypothetical protein
MNTIKIELPVEQVNLLAYACQEMSYRRHEQTGQARTEVQRKSAAEECRQYRVLADMLYAQSAQLQLTGNVAPKS